MNSRMLAEINHGNMFTSVFPGLPSSAVNALLDGPIGVWMCQPQEQWLYLNDAAKSMLGIKLNGNTLEGRIPHILRHLFQQPGAKGITPCGHRPIYSYLIYDDQSMQGGVFINDHHNTVTTHSSERDQQLLKLLMQLPHLAVQGYDQSGQVIHWSQASQELYGYSRQEASSRTIKQLIIPPEHQDDFSDTFQRWLKGPLIAPTRESQRLHKNGELLMVQTTQLLLHPQASTTQLYTIDFDCNSQQQQQQQLHELEHYDHLTRLPNQRFLYSLLHQTLKHSQQLNQQTAVMFIGIDKFKFVNSEFGHDVGDKILQRMADRIIASVGVQDLKSRFGGDVYVLAFSLPDASSQATLIANRLLRTLSAELGLDQGPEKMTASIGIALSPDDGDDTQSLLKHADAALSQAKDGGGDRFVFFDPDMNQSTHRAQFIARDLERAIKEDELTLLYQPQIDLKTNSIPGCEALLRWNHHELGEISPAEFIPILEQQQAMTTLDYWVVRSTLKKIKDLLGKGHFPPRMFINISAASLNHLQFQEHFKNLLQELQVPTETIGIELTEYALINNEPAAVSNLNWCRENGIKIALDDFGTGFSSLSYLSRLPIDIIKIDKCFIHSYREKQGQELIKTIIAIAHNLSMELICEGVQDIEQEFFLKEHGCEMAQGNHYSQAINSEELMRWLQSRHH